MKKLLKPTNWLCAAIGLIAIPVSAQQQKVVQRFNTTAVTNGWSRFWGSAPQTRTFDPTMDVANNLASGALKVTAGFNYTNYGGDNQFALRYNLSGDGNLSGLVVDATKYDRLEFDLYWDPTSPTRTNGDWGGLDVGLVPTDYSQIWFNDFAITNVGVWTHISLPITTNMSGNLNNLTNVGGVVIKMWAGDASSVTMIGTSTFWVDNLKLLPKTFITDFDNNAYLNGFWNWWGGASRTITWDPAQDAQNDTNSGSINISINFSGTGDNQYADGMSLSGNGSYNSAISIHTPSYSSMEFDLLFDTNSTMLIDNINTNGDPNGLGIGLGASSGWGQTWVPNPNQPRVVADGAWHHVSIPLDPSWPDIGGIVFKKWFAAQAQFTGTMNFWVDNLNFIPSTAPLPPPSMTLRKASNGLNLFLAQPGQQYQRESIRSIPADTIQWISNSDTVTYSVTIADFPTTPGVQCHIFLVPDTAGSHAPDYGDPNAIMLDIRGNAAGAGNATFRWKTNQPNANSQMYTAGQGQVGTLNATTVRGTWSVSFANNTNITVSGPGGVVTNLTMPPDAALLFYSTLNSMGTYFGTQPNNPVSIGQNVGISEIKVTSGATVVVDDLFNTVDPTQQVDPTLWQLEMDNPAGIFVITNQPTYWLGWTLPDAGFSLRAKPALNAPGVDPGLTPILDGSSRLIQLSPDLLPNPQQSYFYLLKQ
jgi:hypothetical protein